MSFNRVLEVHQIQGIRRTIANINYWWTCDNWDEWDALKQLLNNLDNKKLSKLFVYNNLDTF